MKRVSGKVKKYGLIGALVAAIIGFLPSLLGGHNDHPVEEFAEELIKEGVCLGQCDQLNIDLSPGGSGFFSEDDNHSLVLSSPKVEEKPRPSHLPPLPKPKGDNLNPGDPLPEPHAPDNQK